MNPAPPGRPAGSQHVHGRAVLQCLAVGGLRPADCCDHSKALCRPPGPPAGHTVSHAAAPSTSCSRGSDCWPAHQCRAAGAEPTARATARGGEGQEAAAQAPAAAAGRRDSRGHGCRGRRGAYTPPATQPPGMGLAAAVWAKQARPPIAAARDPSPACPVFVSRAAALTLGRFPPIVMRSCLCLCRPSCLPPGMPPCLPPTSMRYPSTSAPACMSA